MEMDRFLKSGRFAYSAGYKSVETARDAFYSMCAEGEMSPCEGKIEAYIMRQEGKCLTRYAITVEG